MDQRPRNFIWCPWGSDDGGQPAGWQLARIVGTKVETKVGREIRYFLVRKYLNQSRRWTKPIWVNANGVLGATLADVRQIKRALMGKSIKPRLRF